MSTPMIQFINVSKAFGDKLILDDVSFEVCEGQTFCLIGGSGTGKSVTLKIILGLLPFEKGDVLYRGKSVAHMTTKELKKMRYEMGMVFQGSALFDSLTVAENVAYPLFEQEKFRDEAEALPVVQEKLGLVGLEGIEDVFPANLSGGMKKRVGLARAIAADPYVILYDEPTAGLDPTNVNRIDDLIKAMQKKLGVTSLVVTHHMPSVFKIADTVALLYDRQIQFKGTVKELLQTRNPFVHKFIEGKIGEK